MSAIECTTAGVKDMADGSLRITLEFDQRHAKDAFSLFGARGTSCAVVALTLEAAKQSAQAETIEADKPKGGALAKLAGIWCSEPNFWEWLNQCGVGLSISNENDAKLAIYEICGVMSRIELDSHESAGKRFHENIREPYAAYLKTL